jgi:serine/threonine protein kinase
MAFFCIRCKAEIDPHYKACPFCGEPITDFLRDHLLTPIDGKYQILEPLGVGGMGEVFKVLHVHLNAIRVIKLMRSKIAGDPGAHERFLREARLATKIHHPNVATLYDFSTLPDGSRYMVWEYIDGINLHQLINAHGPLSPRHAARLSEQALLGLDAIHRAGIVHRDVSPENIMVTAGDEDGERVKIIDLGIAKQGNEDPADKTKTGMFVGKWKYCSPEHLGMLGPDEKIDGRADVYSFGIVLYEMLTGVPPFKASTPHGFLLLHASERPRALRAMNPSVTASPELEALIFRALEKNRIHRFDTARDFARAVASLVPLLDDVPGTPLPARMFDETEGLTRPAEVTATTGRSAADAETVSTVPQAAPRLPVTAGSEAPTVASALEERPTFVEATSSDADIRRSSPTLMIGDDAGSMPTVVERIHAPAPATLHETRPTRPKSMWMAAVASIIAVVILIVVMVNRGGKTEPDSQSPRAGRNAAAHLGINAFPWGEVRSIRNLSSGKTVELAERLLTPAPIDLAPGRYEITLSNPAFKQPLLRTVNLRAGEQQMVTLEFANPETVTLPHFLSEDR